MEQQCLVVQDLVPSNLSREESKMVGLRLHFSRDAKQNRTDLRMTVFVYRSTFLIVVSVDSTWSHPHQVPRSFSEENLHDRICRYPHSGCNNSLLTYQNTPKLSLISWAATFGVPGHVGTMSVGLSVRVSRREWLACVLSCPSIAQYLRERWQQKHIHTVVSPISLCLPGSKWFLVPEDINGNITIYY